MPQPKSAGFTGVLHLHGRLADSRDDIGPLNETDLVLTSAEFGDAYLRSGWASRYIYDVVRACTVVLVGYQADDPPMRYLLEALEADRERYPDLHKVFAFAPAAAGKEKLEEALWTSKGIEPLLYLETAEGGHNHLYETLREWRRYASEPTAWRRETLTRKFAAATDKPSESSTAEIVALLQHGDASQLLSEISPAPAWLPTLISQRVFDRPDIKPGPWIVTRLNDAEMIRTCAGLAQIDDYTRFLIEQALDREGKTLSAVRMAAWRTVLSTKGSSRREDIGERWFDLRRRLKNGDFSLEIRRAIASIVTPRLTARRPFLWPPGEEKGEATETRSRLIEIDFETPSYPETKDILGHMPKDLQRELSVFHAVSQNFSQALEEASEIGFSSEYWDRASRDVPSVADHAQNEHHRGFYPITRLLADLWARIAQQDRVNARTLALRWKEMSFLLARRCHLYALSFEKTFDIDEVYASIAELDDRTFWATDAQREIMLLLATRWQEFPEALRLKIEARLCESVPRTIYPADAFEKPDEWESVRDHAAFIRLKRVEAIGGPLSGASTDLLRTISARHPRWVAGPGDRDDFRSWHESSIGPRGRPDVLSKIPDTQLVREALRLQREQGYDQGDVWRVFCAADPERALRGLQSSAAADEWNPEAWRPFLWEVTSKGERAIQAAVATLVLKMPAAPLRAILPAAASWLQRRRTDLTGTPPEDAQFFRLWDKLAEVTYAEDAPPDSSSEEDSDLDSSALNEPGGILAWALHECLSSSNPAASSGLSAELRARFDRVVSAPGRAGLLARVLLMRDLAYLDWIDPDWTAAKLVPLLDWSNPEAAPLWHAHGRGQIGSARLFTALKANFLKAFRRADISEDLVTQLLNALFWSRHPESAAYNLTPLEAKQALAAATDEARRSASWQFWRLMEKDEPEADRGEHWRNNIGPVFRQTWPLDASLRGKRSSHNLVLMALSCGTAFPDAVDAIIEVIVPHNIYSLASSLRLEKEHDELVAKYPEAFLRLVNKLVDPELAPIPTDLANFLEQCRSIDPNIVKNADYIRLFGLRRYRSS